MRQNAAGNRAKVAPAIAMLELQREADLKSGERPAAKQRMFSNQHLFLPQRFFVIFGGPGRVP
jgi:hypothetical protein